MRKRPRTCQGRSHGFRAVLLVAALATWLMPPHRASAQILPPLPGELIVTITSPSSGATVSGTTTVSASVTIVGSLLVAGVQFKLDGANLGAQDTSAPYSISWSTTGTGNGSHTLTAIARDALGVQWASNAVTVTVSNGPPPDTTAPTVSITSPAGGATVSGTVTISATASDNVGVAGVQFFVDGAPRGAEDTTAPYSVSWDTTTASNGSHSLTARARDAAGNTRLSAAVTVTVSNGPPPDTTAPTVSITSPAGGATVSGTVTISATASDNVGVAGVQFFVDGAPRGAEDTTAPYSVSWDTPTVSNGSHSLTARARDAAGNTRLSAAVTVTVSNGPPPDTTRHEETEATLAPAGAWSELSDAGASASLSGGRAVFTATAGATATFVFGGTGVTWIGLPCEICGIAEVSLDGVLVATVDTFAPTRPAASQPVFTRSGLAAGTHTLTIEVTGGQNPSTGGTHVVVDAFDVEGDTSGGGGSATRIEQDHPAVTYTGSWVTQPHPDVSGGTGIESLEAGATASLTFTGTAVKWIGFKATWSGIAEVYLDGTLRGTVDGYSPVAQPQAVMFTASGLPDASHTLTIRVTGTWNPSGESAWVVVDAFDVTGAVGGAPPPPPAARSEESAAALAPATAWFGLDGAQTGVALSGDFAVVASEAGATATFTFTGTEVTWIGFKCEQCGMARVRLDGAVVATVDTYAPSRPAASGAMFSSGPLPAGSHTLVIEVTGAGNPSSAGAFVAVDAFDVR